MQLRYGGRQHVTNRRALGKKLRRSPPLSQAALQPSAGIWRGNGHAQDRGARLGAPAGRARGRHRARARAGRGGVAGRCLVLSRAARLH